MAESDGGLLVCPVQTSSAWSYQELLSGGEVPEIKAYKLGKKRWSYNQVELVVREAGGDRRLGLHRAINISSDALPASAQESGVVFQLQLANGHKAQLHVFLVYEDPEPMASTRPSSARKAAQGARTMSAGGGSSSNGSPPQSLLTWYLVGRGACRKGCCGPVLRAIQRFGRLGKRQSSTSPGSSNADLTDKTNNNMKDPRYLYLSLDEAGTHVGARAFRLLTGLYDQGGYRFLASSVSPPIRVLANNDVPTGAAHLQVHVEVDSAWDGWVGVEPPVISDVTQALALSPPHGRVSASSGAEAGISAGGRHTPPLALGSAGAGGGPSAPSPRPRRAAALANQLLKRGAGSTDISGSGDGSNQTHDGGRNSGRGGGAAVVSPGVYRTRSAAAAIASEHAAVLARRAVLGSIRRSVSHIERGPYGLPYLSLHRRQRSASPSDEEHQAEYGQPLRQNGLPQVDASAGLFDGGLMPEAKRTRHGPSQETSAAFYCDYQPTYTPTAYATSLPQSLGAASAPSTFAPATAAAAGVERRPGFGSFFTSPGTAFAPANAALQGAGGQPALDDPALAASLAEIFVAASLPPPVAQGVASQQFSQGQHLQLLQQQMLGTHVQLQVQAAQYAVLAGQALGGTSQGPELALAASPARQPLAGSDFSAATSLNLAGFGVPLNAPSPSRVPWPTGGMLSAASLEAAGLGLPQGMTLSGGFNLGGLAGTGLGSSMGTASGLAAQLQPQQLPATSTIHTSPMRMPGTPASIGTPSPSTLDVDLFCAEPQHMDTAAVDMLASPGAMSHASAYAVASGVP